MSSNLLIAAAETPPRRCTFATMQTQVTPSKGPTAAPVVALILLALYGLAYLSARETHQLVHFTFPCTGCHAVASSRSASDVTVADVVFAPLAWLETKIHSFPFW